MKGINDVEKIPEVKRELEPLYRWRGVRLGQQMGEAVVFWRLGGWAVGRCQGRSAWSVGRDCKGLNAGSGIEGWRG